MAEGVGADVDLDRVPRKYPGLEPWEVWLSEAQERMVVSIAADRLDEFGARCRRVGVDFADIGEFTGDRPTRGALRRPGGRRSRHGVPARRAAAAADDRDPARPDLTPGSPRTVDDPVATLLAILAHPNVASNEDIIRRYDHEILGATVVRPLVGVGADAPADGVVIAGHAATEGFAVGIGVNPWYGLHDPEAMAIAVVDEAIRNVVAVGADPARIALLDNFSWGDPARVDPGRPRRGRRRLLPGGCALRCALRLRQGLAEQRVRRPRRSTSRRPSDLGDHRRRPCARRRPLCHARLPRRRQRAVPGRHHTRGVRRLAPRHGERAAGRARRSALPRS